MKREDAIATLMWESTKNWDWPRNGSTKVTRLCWRLSRRLHRRRP